MNKLFARVRRNQAGFTLIELLVVVAIIALLATFAVPKLFDAINKSKKAPGQADMNTISSAMERFYFDRNNYPQDGTDANATLDTEEVAAAIRTGYLKSQTQFLNGFKKGYSYISNAAGTYYVLVDPGNLSSVTVTCGVQTQTLTIEDWEEGEPTGSTDGHGLTVYSFAADPTAAELAACTVTAGASIITN